MEAIQDKVQRKSRNTELISVLRKGETSGSNSYNTSPLLKYIGDLMEQAYLAGYNKLNLTEKQVKETEVVQYGDVLAMAQNFVKDKGLRI